MATNLRIDMNLLESAFKLGGFKTKRETVNEALKTFIQNQNQRKIVDLLGKVDLRDDFNHKKGRHRL